MSTLFCWGARRELWGRVGCRRRKTESRLVCLETHPAGVYPSFGGVLKMIMIIITSPSVDKKLVHRTCQSLRVGRVRGSLVSFTFFFEMSCNVFVKSWWTWKHCVTYQRAKAIKKVAFTTQTIFFCSSVPLKLQFLSPSLWSPNLV